MAAKKTRRAKAPAPAPAPRRISGAEAAIGASLGPLVVTLVFFGLALWSWRKWPDPLVDFGRELYTPWRLAEGKLLYRDVESLFEPLSQYWNAVVFKLFGVSLSALVFVNLAILAGLTALVYRWLAAVCDRLAATVAAVVLLAVFGFSQYVGIGNYNFITPYSHEATHATALAVAMIYCLHRWMLGGSLRLAAAAGLCLGLIFLTKTEVAVAAAAAAGAALAAASLSKESPPAVPRAAGCFAAAALAPALLFFFYFAVHVSAADAARYTLAGWTTLFKGEVAAGDFYRRVTGLEDPWGNALRMIRIFAALGALAGIVAAADVLSRRWIKNPFAAFAAGGAASLLIFASLFESIPWRQLGRALPLVTVAALALVIALARKRAPDRAEAARFGSLAAWSVFALILLGKIFLNAHVYHYGFYLAMPATLAAVVGWLWAIPRLLAARWSCGRLTQAFALVAIGAFVVAHLKISDGMYLLKTVPVGAGEDQFFAFDGRASPAGIGVAETLRLIDREVPRDATLVVFPEGVMINYLSRRVNPTPFINFMVPELRQTGEARVVAALAANPPDYVILAHKDTREYGVGFFGSDPAYGKAIMDWVRDRYTTIAIIGAEPLQSGAFGIKLLKRKNS